MGVLTAKSKRTYVAQPAPYRRIISPMLRSMIAARIKIISTRTGNLRVG